MATNARKSRAGKRGVDDVSAPLDQSARDRFAQELDRNFSVVASAGSGKTAAITKRVLSIAAATNALEILPRLVVVTYANRAADEMQLRARQTLLEKNLSSGVQAAFGRTFFGTIHSFCLKLLNNYGHHLGLPTPLELVTDDGELWREFMQSHSHIGRSLGETNRALLFRFMQARDLMTMARDARFLIPAVSELPPFPQLNFSEIYSRTDQRGRNNISRSQAELREWESRFKGDWEFLRWPVLFTSDKAEFTKLWAEKFSPLRKWLSAAATGVASEVQRAYREFRIERGLVTYDDQIALAKELLAHPVAAARIREEKFRVLLDEAQDTEPAQFSVLLEATRPPRAISEWMQTYIDPPPPGHFCMVGDFQQSIYRERADLKYYKQVHEALVRHADGEALTFSVTFRLDQKQLDFVNKTFREILHGRDDQVQFVELQPHPRILPGKVIRVPLGAELLGSRDDLKENEKARIEARYLANWIKEAGLPKLSADSWDQVAILCPRKAWLQTLAAALRKVGLPVAIQSEREVKGDSPAYAWLTALLTIMTDPRNTYEIVGVLREIFGVSDHDLAVFSEGNGSRFCIDEVLAAAGKVSSQLRMLAEIRQRVEGSALFEAVNLVVKETQLRERLSLLPESEFGNLSRELDTLIAEAAEAETSGIILTEFARRLRDEFETERAVRFSADENSIQLITSHKAKGSEWQAVIVPFLGRDMRLPTPPYPHFVRPPNGVPPFVALSKDDKSAEKDALERAYQQDTERLLYVATTRARRTLVLVLDQEIFAADKGRLQKNAQLRRLICGRDFYAGEFDEHSKTIENIEVSETSLPGAEKRAAKIDTLDSRKLKRATNRASDFVCKFTPSALDPDLPVEAEIASRPDNLATLYGRWWHKLLERLDWKGGIDAAQKLFEQELPSSPSPEPASKHWHKTRQKLFDDETIERFLTSDETRFHRELPFSWRRNDRSVVEGLIDSLLVDRAAGRCLLLDWKTNDVAASELESFRVRYLPQLTAYWKAVAEITGLDVEAGLFSTTLGRLLLYSPDELKTEWRRLEQLPPTDLTDEIRPDDE
jgi:ATP-dependent exoDNAse (exonuclease V) beta subunit